MSIKAQKHRLGLCSRIKKSKFLRNIKQESVITNSKQLKPKKSARLLQGQLLQQKLEVREAHQRSLTEMEELRKLQSSAFDTMARRKFIEDQITILELFGRVQELQNEVNCMNDSKDCQDAESIRSGNSHVTSRPVSFPRHPIPEGMLRHSFVTPSHAFGTHMVYRETFLQIQMRPLQHLYPQELNPWSSGISEPLHSSTVEKSERQKTRSRSEMPVWTVSQRFSHPQWMRLFKEL